MKIKIGLDKLFFEYILWFQTINMALGIVMPNMKNKSFLLFFVIAFAYYCSKTAINNKVEFLISSVLLVFYSIYYGLHSGFNQLFHLDFYSYIALAYLFLIFSKKDFLTKFEMFLKKSGRQALYSIYIYWFVIIISIFFFDGLQMGWGVSIPILYGPCELPHELAYSIIIIYCMCAEVYRENKKNFILFLKGVCFFSIIRTGVRSAFLAFFVIMIIDFYSLYSIKKKVIIISLGLFCLMYISVFTDLIVNNPIIAKSISAVFNSGSITNQRGLFSNVVLSAYNKKSTILEWFFGMGIDGVRGTLKNHPAVGVAIHAHNDYVNTLCGYGIVGLIIIIAGQYSVLKLWKNKFVKFMTEMVIIILALTNGLAMYICFTPCMIILFLFSKNSQKSNKKYNDGFDILRLLN